jgi:hypothetical protein
MKVLATLIEETLEDILVSHCPSEEQAFAIFAQAVIGKAIVLQSAQTKVDIDSLVELIPEVILRADQSFDSIKRDDQSLINRSEQVIVLLYLGARKELHLLAPKDYEE